MNNLSGYHQESANRRDSRLWLFHSWSLFEGEDFVKVASVRIELDGNFVVFCPHVGAKVVILLKRCGRRSN
jgi:hypothetical protein